MHIYRKQFTQANPMKKYHYIDDQGNISDALPLAALHKIGLPPATKVLIEGGKQWINLAEAMAGGPAVAPAPPLPPPPPPSVAAPGITATIFNRVLADLNRPVIDGLLNRPEADPSSVKPAKVAKSDNSLKGLKGVLKGCLFLVIGFPILIGVLMYLVDHGFGRAKVSDGGGEAGPTREQLPKSGPNEEIWTNVSSTTGKTLIYSDGPGQQTLVGIGRRHTIYLYCISFINSNQCTVVKYRRILKDDFLPREKPIFNKVGESSHTFQFVKKVLDRRIDWLVLIDEFFKIELGSSKLTSDGHNQRIQQSHLSDSENEHHGLFEEARATGDFPDTMRFIIRADLKDKADIVADEKDARDRLLHPPARIQPVPR